MERRDKLKQIMKTHNLRIRDVAKILNRRPQSVRVWLSVAPAEIPEHCLELLELKVAAMQGNAA